MYLYPDDRFTNAFKAYDIRGRLGSEITEALAYYVGRAYVVWLRSEGLNPRNIAVGSDVRTTSAALKSALSQGIRDEAVNVYDIGLCGTEEVYHAVAFAEPEPGTTFDGGIMVTASHNPIDYNGLKLVREGARPISAADGLSEIKNLIRHQALPIPDSSNCAGHFRTSFATEYLQHLLGYIDVGALKPLKIVVNAGNGAVGPALDGIEQFLPVELIKINHEPNGGFPNGIPNPMLVEQQQITAQAVLDHKADLGLAWDGDFDRCFFFSEKGEFIEGYYLVGVLAKALISKQPTNSDLDTPVKIVHDPRLIWNTQAICHELGGEAIQSVCGHSFIKKIMREQDAAYGGEMSAHHYFRDFAYCDSGMIPWLLIIELLSKTGKTLSEMIGDRTQRFACSGEINISVSNADETLLAVRNRYEKQACDIDETDGIGMDMGSWRFNLRKSNTEPLVRLNVETTAGTALLSEVTSDVKTTIHELEASSSKA
ncbi:phosphomannomutase CpsG [Microbulbifer agarilyticus]|uniref:phosphomannomutase CpsG n=1 Tax=Microbulbifer agarilyticus TaxID=260552 RepID=UPI001C966D9C|nr:phosphomannomutase CpsG [Microbulbifer agarilyticus]MBY6210936.1 phosphomannomutase CpsG [Microbulbifer agarilyticus]